MDSLLKLFLLELGRTDEWDSTTEISAQSRTPGTKWAKSLTTSLWSLFPSLGLPVQWCNNPRHDVTPWPDAPLPPPLPSLSSSPLPRPLPSCLVYNWKDFERKKKVTSAVGTLHPLPFLPFSLPPSSPCSCVLVHHSSLARPVSHQPPGSLLPTVKLLGLKKIQLKKDFKKLKCSICSWPLRTLRLQSGQAGSEQSAGRCTSR